MFIIVKNKSFEYEYKYMNINAVLNINFLNSNFFLDLYLD